jgi:hypothetical protein
VVAYGWLPGLVSGALGIVSLLVGVDPEGFNVKNPVASNPAYFMDPTQHQFLYGMASSVDVFAIWMAVLMGIGYASISKLKRTTAIIIVLVWHFVWKAAMAALGSV